MFRGFAIKLVIILCLSFSLVAQFNCAKNIETESSSGDAKGNSVEKGKTKSLAVARVAVSSSNKKEKPLASKSTGHNGSSGEPSVSTLTSGGTGCGSYMSDEYWGSGFYSYTYYNNRSWINS